jgi:hypothetical protein
MERKMSEAEYPKIEYSKLGRPVDRDGLRVDVQIYRLLDRHDGWSLEVVDHEGASTVWDETFQSDSDAFAAFEEAVAAEGIRTFSAPKH